MKRAWLLGAVLALPPVAAAGTAPHARATAEPTARAKGKARTSPARTEADSVDLSASYSFLRAGEAHLHGADVSAGFPLPRRWRLLADLSVHSGSFAGSDLDQVNFMGGLRRRFGRGGRWQPFGQALLGGAHSTTKFSDVLSTSRTSWGGGVGGGVDYRLSPRWALRGQGDYLVLHSDAGWDGDPRLSLGVAYRFRR